MIEVKIENSGMPSIDERLLPLIEYTIKFYEYCLSSGQADEWWNWIQNNCRKQG